MVKHYSVTTLHALAAAAFVLIVLAAVAPLLAVDSPTIDIVQPRSEVYSVIAPDGSVLSEHGTYRVADENATNAAMANPGQTYRVRQPEVHYTATVPNAPEPPVVDPPATPGPQPQSATLRHDAEPGEIGDLLYHEATGEIMLIARVAHGDRVVAQSWHVDTEQVATGWLTENDIEALRVYGDVEDGAVPRAMTISAESLKNLSPGRHEIQVWVISPEGLSPFSGVGNPARVTINVEDAETSSNPGEDLRQMIAGGSDVVVDPGVYVIATLDAPLQPIEGQTITLRPGAVLIWDRVGADAGKHCPLFYVNQPDVTIHCEPGSSILVRGHVDTLDREHRVFGIPAVFGASVVAIGDDGHRFKCEGLTVRGLTGTDNYTSAIYAVNADNGEITGLDIEQYGIGVRLTNPGIRGWTLTDIRGDNPSQSYLVHGGPCHLIYSLTSDNLRIDRVWEGPRCMNNHVGQRDAHGGVIVQDKSGHTIKISHANATYASGLSIIGLVSHNRSGPLILGGAIDGAVVRYQFDAIEPHLVGPWSPALKLDEPNSAGLKPRGLDVLEVSE